MGNLGDKWMDDWDSIDASFLTALDLPASERTTWLEDVFGSDQSKIDRLARLLEIGDEHTGVFERLEEARDRVLAEANDLGSVFADPRIGAVYGAWRIVRYIGQGGCGVIYEAERADGRYEKTGALKLIRSDVRGSVLDHFMKERRILSRFDHPGLVGILDAGETATGAPWFVMDLIEGRNIIDHCKFERLSLEGRLALVADVAEALQAAHSRLVIHRDIKPDNIIVTESGRARLVDFGIASLAADEDGTTGPAAMTPHYASPEQQQLADITTASDIYQLGRVLGDLCAPFAPHTQQLEAVVAKATHHDPRQRYDTAAGFEDDMRRVIRGDPPSARPDTRIEAAMRLVWRHKVVSALLVMLGAGTIAWFATVNLYVKELETQRDETLAAVDRAERGRSVLLDIFRRLDPLQDDGSGSVRITLDDIVVPVLADMRETMADDPLLQAELLAWAATLSERSGNEPEAREYLRKAAGLLEASAHADTTVYADVLAYKGALQVAAGETDQGKDNIRRALALALAAPENDRFALSTLLRAAHAERGDWAAQRELFDAALQRLDAGPANSEIEVRTGLGRALLELGEGESAEAHVLRAVEVAETDYGPSHPRLALPLSVLAKTRRWRGDVEGSIAAHRRAYDISLAAFGPAYKSTLSHQNNLALALADSGQTGEALALLNRLADQYRRLGSGKQRDVGETLQNLATVQLRAGQPAAALRSIDRAQAIFDDQVSEGSALRAFPLLTRSEALLALRRYPEARETAQAAFEILSVALPQGHFATEVARCRVGLALSEQGQRAAGSAHIRTALAALSANKSTPVRHLEGCRKAAQAFGIDRSV